MEIEWFWTFKTLEREREREREKKEDTISTINIDLQAIIRKTIEYN